MLPKRRGAPGKRGRAYQAYLILALKGCHTQGDTVEEAIQNAREAIEAYLESLKARGEEVPTEDILIKPVEVVL